MSKPDHETLANKRLRLHREAEERLALRAKRTPAQQLALLARKPGESKRERARLQGQLAKVK